MNAFLLLLCCFPKYQYSGIGASQRYRAGQWKFWKYSTHSPFQAESKSQINTDWADQYVHSFLETLNIWLQPLISQPSTAPFRVYINMLIHTQILEIEKMQLPLKTYKFCTHPQPPSMCAKVFCTQQSAVPAHQAPSFRAVSCVCDALCEGRTLPNPPVIEPINLSAGKGRTGFQLYFSMQK